MAIEIVDLPMKNGDFPQLCQRLPEGIAPCSLLLRRRPSDKPKPQGKKTFDKPQVGLETKNANENNMVVICVCEL